VTRRLLALAALLLSGGCSPLVGAECATGRSECGGVCVDTDTDPLNCGGCGITCDGPCVAGSCPGGVDAAPVDGGGVVDAGVDLDAGPRPCDVGELRCGGVCVDPDTSHDHCGMCDNPCGAQICAGGTCQDACLAPLQQCGPVCVDTQTDPHHCGTCPNQCASGICEAGMCADVTSGHVVVIGHDYRASSSGMRRLVGNAVFLALGNPVEVLAYEGDARSNEITGTDQAVDQVAGETGRSWNKTVAATADSVPYLLQFADVFLVYSQSQATDAALLALGDAWQVALDTFARTGGVVIVLDGGGSHAGTYQLLAASGLFSASARTVETGQTLMLSAATDSIATNVPVIYNAPAVSVGFDTAQATQVVTAPDGKPVVVHRAVTP